MASSRLKNLSIVDTGKQKRNQTLKPFNAHNTTVRVSLLVFSAFLVILIIDLNLVSCEPKESEPSSGGHSCLTELQIDILNYEYFEDESNKLFFYVLPEDESNLETFVEMPAVDADGNVTLVCSSNKPVSWESKGNKKEDLKSVVKRVIIEQYPTGGENEETDKNKPPVCYYADINVSTSPIFGVKGYTCSHSSAALPGTRKSLYFDGSNNARVQFIKPTSGSTIVQVDSVSPDEVIIPCGGNPPNISNDAVKLTKEISPGKPNETFKKSYKPKNGFTTITPRNFTSDSSGVFIESLYGRYKCSGLENGTVEAVFNKTDPSKVKNVQERSAELTVDLKYDENDDFQWFGCSLNSSNSSSTSELNPANFSMHYVRCKNPAHCQLMLKYLHNLSVDSPKLSEGRVNASYDEHLRKLKWNATVPVPKVTWSAAGIIICRTQNKLKYQYAQFFKTVDDYFREHPLLLYEDRISWQLSSTDVPPQYASEKSSDIDPSPVIQIKLHPVNKTDQNSKLNLTEVTMNVSCSVSSFMFSRYPVQLLVEHSNSNGKIIDAKIMYYNRKYFVNATSKVTFLIGGIPQDIRRIICRAPTWNSGEWISHSIPMHFKEEMNKYVPDIIHASPEETLPFYNTYASGIAVMKINMKSLTLDTIEPSPFKLTQELLEGVTMKISCELSSFLFTQGSQKLFFQYSNNATEIPAIIKESYPINGPFANYIDGPFANDIVFLVSNSRENIRSIICRAPFQNSREMASVKYDVSLPIIISASESTVVVYDTDSDFSIFCEVGGIPLGTVEWYHNNKIYEGLPNNSKGLHKAAKNTTELVLHFNQTTVNFSSIAGIYFCNATNFIGTTQHKVYIDVKSHSEKQLKHWLTITVTVAILSISVIAALLLWLYRYRKSIKGLKDDFIELGKDYYDGFKRHFADDDEDTRSRIITSVRTNVGFVRALQKHYNQSKLTIKDKHLIKYNETPIKSGNFGQIYRAKLIKGRKWSKKVTEVVVKESINRKPGDAVDLLAEFKTLLYVGEQEHPNIVRLLGAVVNFRKRNFQIVLEWCENGSLKDFLEENKSNYSESRRDFVCPPESLNLQDNSANSTEGSDTRNTITREDLIRWCYELACGMEHLSSLQLVHADLAIRNLLLTKERVLKITDFGFSKMLRQYDEFYTPGPNSTHHQKQFPWRSLAVECTNATKLSTKSDVWAYGVTLWEIFSLGNIPYGTTSAAALEQALQRGVRLSRPTHATNRIYKVMGQCWSHDPQSRPEFSSLAATFKDILKDETNEEGNPTKQQQQPVGPTPEQDTINYVQVGILNDDADENVFSVDTVSPSPKETFDLSHYVI